MSLKALAIAAFTSLTLSASDGTEVEDVQSEAPPIEQKEKVPTKTPPIEIKEKAPKKPKREPNNSRKMYAAVEDTSPEVG